jgi:hypothetical protein
MLVKHVGKIDQGLIFFIQFDLLFLEWLKDVL